MARWGIWAVLATLLAPLGWAQLPFSGDLDLTLQVLPTLAVQESELTLELTLAGFRVESESTFYHDGLRFKSFDASGKLGEFDLWGRISFHARDLRYRTAWVNLETTLGGGTIRLSMDHWSALGEYTSSDEDQFGPWPCANAILWHEAVHHVGRTLYVAGPVVGYEHAGHLRLFVGRPFPDPDRFVVHISAGNVLGFEQAFGPRFWEAWLGRAVCAFGEIADWRTTADGGYSVAQVTISNVSALALGICCGLPPRLTCPANAIRWFEARSYAGQAMYVQGPIVSYASEGGVPNRLLRIGGGAGVANRLELHHGPAFPAWFRSQWPVGRFVCVYGPITLVSGVARIVVTDLAQLAIREGPCCQAGLLPGTLLNQRFLFRWDPLTVTVDFADCGAGFRLGRVTIAAARLPALCCGVTLDASATFSRCRGLERLDLLLTDVPLTGHDLVADIEVLLTPDAKTVSFAPRWPRVSGCITVYGDVLWTAHDLSGFAVYGWGISCSLGGTGLRLVTALDPDAVEDMTDITFYRDEFAYLAATHTGGGCCGGALAGSAKLWFGTRGILFGLQRVRLDLDVPVLAGMTFFARGQWDFAAADPLDWLDLGLEVSF